MLEVESLADASLLRYTNAPIRQALFEEGGTGGGASENRLANFLRDSVNVNAHAGDEGEESLLMESEDEGEGGGLW